MAQDEPPAEQGESSSRSLDDAPDQREAAQHRLTAVLSSSYVVNRATLRGILAIAIGVTMTVWPHPTEAVLGILVGLALLFSGLIDWFARAHAGRAVVGTRVAVQLLVGVVLVAWPGATLELIGFLLGLAGLLYGLVEVAAAGTRWRRLGPGRGWRVVRGLLLIGGSLAVAFDPALIAGLAIAAVGGLWLVSALIAAFYVLQSPDRRLDDAPEDPAETYRIVALWLRSHELEDAEREWLTAKLFFEGAAFRARLGRFTVLMVAAVVIATLGVVTDSVAVVIGAMLISPLMTPIMGTAAALVMAWPRRAARAGLTVLGGVLGAIALAFLITRFLPSIPSAVDNAQIASRVSPTLLDLVVALAAGAAGAYATTRRDVSDSLPGVAIAIALVPPLTVVGISLSSGHFDEAAGAGLLFATNFVSILLAGGVVFVLTGYTPIYRLREESLRVRTAIGSVAVGLLVIAVPLAITGHGIAADALALDEAEQAVADWLGVDTDFDVVLISVDGSSVEVIVAGPGDTPDVEDLVERLARDLARRVDLELRVVPELIERVSSGG